MYTCVYRCVYMHVECVHVRMDLYMYIRICSCTYQCAYVSTDVYTCMYVEYVYIRLDLYMYVHTNVYICVLMLICIYVRICTCMYKGILLLHVQSNTFLFI